MLGVAAREAEMTVFLSFMKLMMGFEFFTGYSHGFGVCPLHGVEDKNGVMEAQEKRQKFLRKIFLVWDFSLDLGDA